MISRAHLAHNLGKFYAMSRHATPTATPSPQSEQLHTMGNHTPNGTRAGADRHTIANETGNRLHQEQQHPTPGYTIAPTEVCFRISPVKSRLLLDTDQLLRAAVALSRSRFA